MSIALFNLRLNFTLFLSSIQSNPIQFHATHISATNLQVFVAQHGPKLRLKITKLTKDDFHFCFVLFILIIQFVGNLVQLNWNWNGVKMCHKSAIIF